jgi:hypothetical protein
MFVIMQKDMETRQTITIAGITSRTREDAQAEFTQWIRNRIIEDGAGEYREDPNPGLYDTQYYRSANIDKTDPQPRLIRYPGQGLALRRRNIIKPTCLRRSLLYL